tara:strand:+ start:7798 stop:8418 length:621 start_codon:yes stop_codon:yes gene_type:complete
LIPCFSKLEEVSIPLAADPALQRQSGPVGAVGRYYATSDPSALDGYDLDAVTRVRIRALTEAEMMAAKREPGMMPKHGAELARDDRAWSEMSDTERDALAAYVEWERALRMAHIRRGLVSLDEYEGAKAVEAVESIQPDALRVSVVMELHCHIQNISTLGPVGKAPSKPASGNRPAQAASSGGTAPIAQAESEKSEDSAADLSSAV